jgi:hypothetical protein
MYNAYCYAVSPVRLLLALPVAQPESGAPPVALSISAPQPAICSCLLQPGEPPREQ